MATYESKIILSGRTYPGDIWKAVITYMAEDGSKTVVTAQIDSFSTTGSNIDNAASALSVALNQYLPDFFTVNYYFIGGIESGIALSSSKFFSISTSVSASSTNGDRELQISAPQNPTRELINQSLGYTVTYDPALANIIIEDSNSPTVKTIALRDHYGGDIAINDYGIIFTSTDTSTGDGKFIAQIYSYSGQKLNDWILLSNQGYNGGHNGLVQTLDSGDFLVIWKNRYFYDDPDLLSSDNMAYLGARTVTTESKGLVNLSDTFVISTVDFLDDQFLKDRINISQNTTGVSAISVYGMDYSVPIPYYHNDDQSFVSTSELIFNGSEQYIVGLDNNLPIGSEQRTLIAWVKTDDQSSLKSVAEWGSLDGSAGRFALMVDAGGRAYFSGQYADLVGNTAINDNEWHKLAIVYDGISISIYVDNQLDVSSSTTSPGFNWNTFDQLNTTGRQLTIGKSAIDEQFVGAIQNVSVWNKALAEPEIAALPFNLQGDEAHLVSYYPLEGVEGGLAAISDRSLSSDNLQLVGFSSNSNYYEFRGKVYQVITDTATWQDALNQSTAKAFAGVNGQLATITSSEEQEALEHFLTVSGLAADGLWLAGSDSEQEGVWKWRAGLESGENFWNGDATGSAVAGAYENWDQSASPSQPNTDANSESEDYLFFGIDADWNSLTRYKWSDAPGSISLPYLVEYDPTYEAQFYDIFNDKPIGELPYFRIAKSNQGVIAVWQQDFKAANGAIVYQRYDGYGATIGAKITVKAQASDTYVPSIAELSNGNVVVAFQSYQSGHRLIEYFLYDENNQLLRKGVIPTAYDFHQASVLDMGLGAFAITYLESENHPQTPARTRGVSFFDSNGEPDGGVFSQNNDATDYWANDATRIDEAIAYLYIDNGSGSNNLHVVSQKKNDAPVDVNLGPISRINSEATFYALYPKISQSLTGDYRALVSFIDNNQGYFQLVDFENNQYTAPTWLDLGQISALHIVDFGRNQYTAFYTLLSDGKSYARNFSADLISSVANTDDVVMVSQFSDPAFVASVVLDHRNSPVLDAAGNIVVTSVDASGVNLSSIKRPSIVPLEPSLSLDPVSTDPYAKVFSADLYLDVGNENLASISIWDIQYQLGGAGSVMDVSFQDATGWGLSMSKPGTGLIDIAGYKPTDGAELTGVVRLGTITVKVDETFSNIEGLMLGFGQTGEVEVTTEGGNPYLLANLPATVDIADTPNQDPQGTFSIDGDLKQGEKLEAISMVTDADGVGAFSYQWLADGVELTGKVENVLILQQEHVGKVISLNVSYVDDQGTVESLTSSTGNSVQNVNDAPTIVLINGNTAPASSPSVNEDGSSAHVWGQFELQDVDIGDVVKWVSVNGMAVIEGGSGSDEQVVTNGLNYGAIAYYTHGLMDWRYEIDNTSAAVQGLAEGEVVSEDLVFIGQDAQGATVEAHVTVNITGKNDAPTVESQIEAQATFSDTPYTLTFDPSTLFSDVDGDSLAITVAGLPSGLSFDGIDTIAGTIPNSVAGEYTVSVIAGDAHGGSVTHDFSLMVGAQLGVTTKLWGSGFSVDSQVALYPEGTWSSEYFDLEFTVDVGADTFTAKLFSTATVSCDSLQFSLGGIARGSGMSFTPSAELDGWSVITNISNNMDVIAAYNLDPTDTSKNIEDGDLIGTISGKLLGSANSKNVYVELSGLELGTQTDPLDIQVTSFEPQSSNGQGVHQVKDVQPNSYKLHAKAVMPTFSADPITAADAVEILKLALGVSTQQSDPFAIIAADINQDGRVSAYDAYMAALMAVDSPNAISDEILLIDAAADLTAISRRNVEFDQGADVVAMSATEYAVELTGVLLGDVNHSAIIVI
jgi:VCBS repeat-containing protein